MRPCRICPDCKRAVAIQTNGTFYLHRDRNSGVQDDGHRRRCAWSGLQPPGEPDPLPEPRLTMQQLREQLAAANERADTAEQERDRYADAYHRLDSQQASAGSYAERAEKAEARLAKVRTVADRRVEAAREREEIWRDKIMPKLVELTTQRDDALARLAELGDPEIECRFVDAYGSESDVDPHNDPCDCRKESRLACAGPWLAANALPGWDVDGGVAK